MNFPAASDHYLVEADMRTDAEAIAASVEQPDEFVAIFERHFVAVYRYVARRFGVDAAADLASETFTRAFASRARYRPQTPSALPWLLGIATRLGANQRRREARRLHAYRVAACRSPGSEESPSENGSGALDQRLVLALEGLKRRDRDALLLFAWADFGYSEIAEALQIPVGTVRSRINRGRRQLRDALDKSAPALVDGGDHGD